ncbi:MAG TPA: hypothetical protein DEV93_20330 [Chloroflexi bacterium]|jgi:hypothetical protein|nr:hypothetical protein [Chloroflexota bacterium]
MVEGSQARIITAVDVTPREVPDKDLLERLYKEYVGTMGHILADVADAKYGSYAYCKLLEETSLPARITPVRGWGDQREVPSESVRSRRQGKTLLLPQRTGAQAQGHVLFGPAAFRHHLPRLP